MLSQQPQPDIREIVQKLESEPLTHLMLGHRELFHSNLIAWFFNYLPDEADEVFGRLTGEHNRGVDKSEGRKVHREKKNLDLHFYWPNRYPLVIENKVFSLPDEEQLGKYTKEKNIGDAALFLLSLSDPNWENDQREIHYRKWRWLSFAKLGELIYSALPADDHSYEVETMRHYAGVVVLLHQLATRVVTSGKTVRLPDDVAGALSDNRLMSSMAKLRASFVEQRVRRALREVGVTQTNVTTNMTNGLPLNDWFCPISDEWDAGWQVQGNQFRLAIRLKGNSDELWGNNAKVKREAFAERNEELFSLANLDDILGTGNEVVSKFCHYNPDFVYRYKKVSDLTIDQLEVAAVAIARRHAAVFP